MPSVKRQDENVVKRAIKKIREHNKLLGRKQKPLPKPPAVIRPAAEEFAYKKALVAIARKAIEVLKEEVSDKIEKILSASRSHRNNSDSMRYDQGEIENMIAGVRFRFQRFLNPAEIAALARGIANRVERQNFTQTAKGFKKVLGIDIIKAEPWLAGEIENFVAENVDLITSIPEQYFDKVRKTVTSSVTSGESTESLAKKIVGVVDLEGKKALNRARLIARDQTFKFYSNVTKERQTRLGLTSYRWITKRDLRVRGTPGGFYPKAEFSHYERDNEIFSWDDPPEDGHAGQAINCRCVPGLNFEEE